MFALEVSFLTGRYVATAFDDRLSAEWPPHPARLFSAMAAAYFESESPSEGERSALQWLERLDAPEIAASDAAERDVCTVFVPVNDTTIVPDCDDEVQALEDLRREQDDPSISPKARTAIEKKVQKAEAKMKEALRKATAPFPPGKEPAEALKRAANLLPDGRTKQPRTFPSVTPSDPKVVFAWPHAEPPPATLSALDELAARVVRLGHSSSLVSVRALGTGQPAATDAWVPASTDAREGQVIRIVGGDQLCALEEIHARMPDAPGRVLPAVFRRYARRGAEAPEATLPRSIFSEDWLVLRRQDGPRLPSRRVVEVARAVRSALLKAHGPDAPEILTGHDTREHPSPRAHLACVPLPNVGHHRADGVIMGVALVLPRDVSGEDRRIAFRAMASWESRARMEDSSEDRDNPVAVPILLGRAGKLEVARMDQPGPATLTPATWCNPSRRWASVTPVALDRNCGDLRSDDPRKEAEAYRAAEEVIAMACERIGLPRPTRVVATPAAPIAGAEKARFFPTFKNGFARTLVHALLEFEGPVRGPVLLGAGRFHGLGLFRPVHA